jgi:hypothetical protein
MLVTATHLIRRARTLFSETLYCTNPATTYPIYRYFRINPHYSEEDDEGNKWTQLRRNKVLHIKLFHTADLQSARM